MLMLSTFKCHNVHSKIDDFAAAISNTTFTILSFVWQIST